ncbi:MAG: hypothetical protein KC609_08640, partial [Myxococcales bacterium]|nr:hypothetical protein [Myxococcales bacterium]
MRIAEIHWNELGDDEAAVSAYEQVLERVPADRETRATLVDICLMSGRPQQAADHLNELCATESSPIALGQYYAQLASIYRDELGDPDSALDFLLLTLDANFNCIPAFEAIVEILMERQDWNELADQYREMIQRTHELGLSLKRRLAVLYRDALDDAEAAVELVGRAEFEGLEPPPEPEQAPTAAAALVESSRPKTPSLDRDPLAQPSGVPPLAPNSTPSAVSAIEDAPSTEDENGIPWPSIDSQDELAPATPAPRSETERPLTTASSATPLTPVASVLPGLIPPPRERPLPQPTARPIDALTALREERAKKPAIPALPFGKREKPPIPVLSPLRPTPSPAAPTAGDDSNDEEVAARAEAADGTAGEPTEGTAGEPTEGTAGEPTEGTAVGDAQRLPKAPPAASDETTAAGVAPTAHGAPRLDDGRGADESTTSGADDAMPGIESHAADAEATGEPEPTADAISREDAGTLAANDDRAEGESASAAATDE